MGNCAKCCVLFENPRTYHKTIATAQHTNSHLLQNECEFISLTIKQQLIMTREEARKAAEVMLAYANGAEIEYKDAITGKWSANKEPNFNWFTFDYRIKSKQEKFDPKTLQQG